MDVLHDCRELNHRFVMTDTLRLSSATTRSRLMVPECAAVLKRVYFLLRELIVMQAGWVPGLRSWETKLLLPELLWEDSTTLRLLRERILELRFPERRLAPGDDAALLASLRRWADAPSGEAFAFGSLPAAQGLLRRLVGAYLQVADSLNDGPTVRILQQFARDLDAHRERLGRLRERNGSGGDDAAWIAACARLDATDALPLLAPQAEPLPPPPPGMGRPFVIDRQGARDPRFIRLAFAWPDRLDPSRPAGEGLELQMRVAVHHLNEIWAAEMAAAVLHDLAGEAPPDFLEDAARWCYDETRHCRMGYERLRAWGLHDGEMPVDAFSYAASAGCDPLVRLGTIFYFETTYIHTKSERCRIFTREGDTLSARDMDFDWADELIHTHYGTKWLGHFLKQRQDPRTPEDVKQAAQAAVRHLQDRASPADRAATEAGRETLLARARELAGLGGRG